MSRHRHIRNMDLDDEDDGYDDWENDYYEEEEEAVDAEAAQYLKKSSPSISNYSNTAPPVQQTARDTGAENNDIALRFLCEEFSRVLGHNLMLGDVKRALVDNDYNQDAALAYLRQLHTSNNASLLLQNPSAIGQLITEANSPRSSSASSASRPSFNASSQQHVGPIESVVTSGRALYPQDANDSTVQRFNFQDPSPDDLMEARRGRGRERAMGAKLKLPKPSNKPSAAKSAFKALLEDTSPAQNSGQAASSSSTSSKKKLTLPTKSTGKARKLRVPTKSEPRAPKSTLRTSSKVEDSAQAQPAQKEKKKPAVQRIKTVNVTDEAKKAVATTSSLSIVVSGHVDAGKSTLLGQLLKSLNVDVQSTKGKGRVKTHGDLAHILDSDSVEQERGVTIDFCVREFERQRKGKLTTFAMLDSPGHRDFVPAMISGATQASAAVLVVDASIGEFESGISENGQTKEHAVLLRAVGISHLVVAINKLDTVEYDKDRFEYVKQEMRAFLKANGWRSPAKFVPVAGRVGTNVTEKAGKECKLSEWYKGPTFLETLENLADLVDKESEKRIVEEPTKPTRLLVSDSFRSTSLGGVISVTGRLLLGSVAPRDTLVINPSGLLATVKNIEVNGQRVKLVIAGVHNTPVSVSLTEVPDTLMLSAGDVLCDPLKQVPVVTKFRAQIVTRNPEFPLIEGSAVEVHVGGGSEAGNIRKLVELKGRDGEPAKKRPRRLVKGDTAIVEVKLSRAMCMEKSADLKYLGFFTLRARGRSVAVGIILDILKGRGIESKKKTSEKTEQQSDNLEQRLPH